MKKTHCISGIILSVVFLVAVQAQADFVTFDFVNGNTDTTYLSGAYSKFGLTATDNGNGGVDFLFTSSWTSGNNGTPGSIRNGNLFFYNVNDIFDFSKTGTDSGNLFGSYTNADGGIVSGNTFKKNDTTGLWEVGMTLDFLGDIKWEDFLTNVFADEDMFGFSAAISGMNGAGWSGKFVAGTGVNGNVSVTNSTPEPATLAVLGLGLAGLGMTRRRRRK